MSTKRRFNAVTPRPKYGEEGAVWWHQVGNAVENDKGQISIYLDSVPVPDQESGSIKIMLFEKKSDDEKPKPRPAATRGGRRSDMDEEIPF